MLEIPESKTISLQAGETLVNRRITEVFNASSPHKFAWFYGDPAGYAKILAGRQVISTSGHGMFVDIRCDADLSITIGDGTNMTYLGGRDTERNFFGHNGGYKTLLSKNTVKTPCPNCGNLIVKEAYLGGAVYFCPSCQKFR